MINNKCSDRSMEVKLPALLGNYDRQTNQPADRPTNLRTDDKQVHREVKLLIKMVNKCVVLLFYCLLKVSQENLLFKQNKNQK